MIPQFLLPPNVELIAEALNLESGALRLTAAANQPYSCCPVCHDSSKRIHSKYVRKLLDLPVSGHIVQVRLMARKYFCDNHRCPRKVFTERFDHQIRPYYRRMLRSNDLLTRIALQLGGNKGAVISEFVGVPVSSATVLRIIKKTEIPPISTSGVIGIDDWAFKKGRTYGTVVIDLKNREVLDLLPDRQSDTLAAWLKLHPEIHTVSRDRYGPYALGVKEGAPRAIQVADRFHLLMNLGEATKRALQARGKELKAAFNLYNHIETEQGVMKPSESVSVSCNHASSDRLYKFERIKELLRQGTPIRKIARITEVQRPTIRRYIHLDTLEKKQYASITNWDAFIPFLRQETNRLKTNRELHRIICEMGFNGQYSQFCNRMKELRGSTSTHAESTRVKSMKTWSPSRLSMLLYADAESIKNKDDREFLKLLFQKFPEIKTLEQQVKNFKQLFVSKEDGHLREWIQQVSISNCGLKGFAQNILKDFEAVNNAIITPYSNGQTEGQVNRLKLIKRKMYGRAGFQLLRQMVLAKTG